MDWISSLLLATVRLAIPVLLISLAELYGQRAGMVNIGLPEIEMYEDVSTQNAYHTMRHLGFTHNMVMKVAKYASRDNARTPVQWSAEKNAGFTDEERGKFTDLLNAGFIDTWRYFYPDTEGIYSWWSYRFKAREKNAGWRIDYFCVSESLKDDLESAKIHTEVFGSDHCPVELVIKR